MHINIFCFRSNSMFGVLRTMCIKPLENRVRIAQVPEMLGMSDLPSLSMLPGRSSCVETQRTQSFDVILQRCEGMTGSTSPRLGNDIFRMHTRGSEKLRH